MHPMMRHLTDAAPQEGERAFRSGALPGSEQPETAAERGMRGAAEREMGDLTEAGDAPFGGEVAVDSQVCCVAVFRASKPQQGVPITPWLQAFPRALLSWAGMAYHSACRL